jgi:hypothetical protein
MYGRLGFHRRMPPMRSTNLCTTPATASFMANRFMLSRMSEGCLPSHTLRLVTLKLYALRCMMYFRSASDQDRRYLMYNAILK